MVGLLGVGGVPAAIAGPSPAALARLADAARNLVPAQGFQLTLPTARPSRPPDRAPRPSVDATPSPRPTALPSPRPTALPSPRATAPPSLRAQARAAVPPSRSSTRARSATQAPTPRLTPFVSPRAQIVAVPTAGTIASIILAAAERHGVSYSWLLGVATCESGLNPDAVNGSSGATGLFQFMPGTFYGHGGTDIWSAAQQADIAAAMFAGGESGQWACA
ncbi:MAG TPA: transglycosylase SLT domain-containing protein [Candidatus Micrarchaeia archaeon]|nr:transglycosylase SLT domain-containing protein [Candidatus Micrarchaeia archaeon]